MSPSAAIPGISGPRAPAGVTLVLGGARSGKSRFAEDLLSGHAGRRVYLATAEPGDAEMAERIRRHRARRGAAWTTREAPLDLAPAIRVAASEGAALLVDCLTLWLSNLLATGRDPAAERVRLVGVLEELRTPIVLVSNEVGLGIVPDNALARAFRDHAGLLHQAVAGAADRVYFIAAGLPLPLKEGRGAATADSRARGGAAAET